MPEPTSESVKEAFIEYFEENQWGVLQEIVASWEENPYFVRRMSILHDALEAHIQGKYTLSIPALLSQVEGVASGIVEKPAGDTTRIMKTAIENIDYGNFVRAACKDILVAFVTSPVGYGGVKSEYMTLEKYPEWLKAKGHLESQTLNRHAILHGMQIDYASKENSLRALLLLDVLFWMKREEWDEDFKQIVKGA